MLGSESMLGVGKGEGVKFGEEESFKDFDGRTKEGYGPVPRSRSGRFTRLRDRDYYRVLPD